MSPDFATLLEKFLETFKPLWRKWLPTLRAMCSVCLQSIATLNRVKEKASKSKLSSPTQHWTFWSTLRKHIWFDYRCRMCTRSWSRTAVGDMVMLVFPYQIKLRSGGFWSGYGSTYTLTMTFSHYENLQYIQYHLLKVVCKIVIRAVKWHTSIKPTS